MTILSYGLARSREKLEQLYLHYHNAYGHKTWRDGEYHEWFLPLESQDMSTTTMPMATQLGKVGI